MARTKANQDLENITVNRKNITLAVGHVVAGTELKLMEYPHIRQAAVNRSFSLSPIEGANT